MEMRFPSVKQGRSLYGQQVKGKLAIVRFSKLQKKIRYIVLSVSH